jgi:hypothetical protein
MVDELSAKGVTFEQYGEPFNTDEKGIARFEGQARARGSKIPTATSWLSARSSPPEVELPGAVEPASEREQTHARTHGERDDTDGRPVNVVPSPLSRDSS